MIKMQGYISEQFLYILPLISAEIWVVALLVTYLPKSVDITSPLAEYSMCTSATSQVLVVGTVFQTWIYRVGVGVGQS